MNKTREGTSKSILLYRVCEHKLRFRRVKMIKGTMLDSVPWCTGRRTTTIKSVRHTISIVSCFIDNWHQQPMKSIEWDMWRMNRDLFMYGKSVVSKLNLSAPETDIHLFTPWSTEHDQHLKKKATSYTLPSTSSYPTSLSIVLCAETRRIFSQYKWNSRESWIIKKPSRKTNIINSRHAHSQV